jgi:hypothetical protein
MKFEEELTIQSKQLDAFIYSTQAGAFPFGGTGQHGA